MQLGAEVILTYFFPAVKSFDSLCLELDTFHLYVIVEKLRKENFRGTDLVQGI